MQKERKIVLVAESGADLKPEHIRKYGIYVVSMYVTMGERTLQDWSFPTTDLYDYYERTGIIPKTSAPNVQDYADCYEKIHKEFPQAKVLHLCYSAATSCSYQNAVMASEDMPYVVHVDSKGVTAGQGALVLRTARYIETHPNIEMEELLPLVEKWISASCMVFMPQNVEYLRAGGRVSNVAYMGASLLSIKPLIEIVDGKLVSTKKYRGRLETLIPKIIQDFFEKYNPDRRELYVLWAEGFEHLLDGTVEKELRKYGVENPEWIETGAVITSHGGPGAFGLAGFRR